MDTLGAWIQDARQRTLALVDDLDDLMGPRMSIVNPLLWEIAHVAWFQEKWILRHAYGHRPLWPHADALYDSSTVAHDTRWDLPLPSRDKTLAYLGEVHDRVLERIASGVTPEARYFIELAVFHEDMHGEAFTYTRQTLGHPPPSFATADPAALGPWPGDAVIQGGPFLLGATEETAFVFDNEKWGHTVDLADFAIARAPVTQEEFSAFVQEGGYTRPELWNRPGWEWRVHEGATQPLYWRNVDGVWQRRHFDAWVPIEPHRAMIHVNWYEADAYCRFAKRRLPTEAEWERAAGSSKRRFPFGDATPTASQANLDTRMPGCTDVAAHPAGDTAEGLRQMIGNVWEWTSSDFLPYPGFVVDPYREYSQPWFRTHKVLRGGCFATRARLLRNTWRNFYTPDRRDVLAGFRTCRA